MISAGFVWVHPAWRFGCPSLLRPCILGRRLCSWLVFPYYPSTWQWRSHRASTSPGPWSGCRGLCRLLGNRCTWSFAFCWNPFSWKWAVNWHPSVSNTPSPPLAARLHPRNKASFRRWVCRPSPLAFYLFAPTTARTSTPISWPAIGSTTAWPPCCLPDSRIAVAAV